MTGGPPYTARSPTQQSHFAQSYSPPSSKSRPYYPNNEHYQHPPHTPPTFPPPPSLARSPQYGHPSSPLNTTLPPLNGTAPPPTHPHHSDSSPQYHGHSASSGPPYPLHRPYSGSMLSGNASTPPNPYSHSTPSHTHPGSRPDNLSQSPKKEMDMPFDMIQGRGSGGYSAQQSPMMREQRPSSPKETVRL